MIFEVIQHTTLCVVKHLDAWMMYKEQCAINHNDTPWFLTAFSFTKMARNSVRAACWPYPYTLSTQHRPQISKLHYRFMHFWQYLHTTKYHSSIAIKNLRVWTNSILELITVMSYLSWRLNSPENHFLFRLVSKRTLLANCEKNPSITGGFPSQRASNAALQWRHNERDSVSNHQPHECLLNRLFGRRSQKTSKLRVTGLCARNSPGTGEFPAQMASNAENVSIRWRHHGKCSHVMTPW